MRVIMWLLTDELRILKAIKKGGALKWIFMIYESWWLVASDPNEASFSSVMLEGKNHF